MASKTTADEREAVRALLHSWQDGPYTPDGRGAGNNDGTVRNAAHRMVGEMRSEARADLIGWAANHLAGLLDDLDAAERREETLRAALDITPDDVGRIMHESWSRTKRAQGFHGKDESCTYGAICSPGYTNNDYPFGAGSSKYRCPKFHPDLIPWEELPQGQQDLNLHAFDDVLAAMKQRAALAASAPEGGQSS